MEIDVIYSVWGADGFDEPLSGGRQTIAKPTKSQIRSIAGAEAAGCVTVVSASKEERKQLNDQIQSQHDGEKALAAAQKSGAWHEANRAQFLLDAETMLADPELDPEQRAWLTQGVADVRAQSESEAG